MSQERSIAGPDINGYYNVTLHRFGVPEKSGTVYEWGEGALAAIRDVGERAAQGRVHAEYGFPDVRELDDEARYHRISTIHEDRTCANLSNITVDMESGLPVVMAKAYLSGPMAKAAREMIEQGDERVAFGLRGFSRKSFAGGKVLTHLLTAVTFDFVQAPAFDNLKGNPLCPTVSLDSPTSPE